MNTKKIVKLEQEILKAMKNGNVKILNELLHEKLLFNIPNGATITKETDLETYSSGNMKITEIVYSDQQITMIGENAVVSVIAKMKGSFFNNPIDGTYKILRVWKLFNNQWKVIAGSSIGI